MLQQRGIATQYGAIGFPGEEAGDWFVLHTRSRQEKALEDELRVMNVARFLPLLRQVKYYGNRKATIDEPLFPGYLFMRGSLDQVYEADRTKRIAQIIRVADQGRLDWELRNLFLALSQQVQLDPFPLIKEGVRVQIRSGPMRGVQGLVERKSAWNRLILTVQILGRGVSMEVDGALLELAE